MVYSCNVYQRRWCILPQWPHQEDILSRVYNFQKKANQNTLLTHRLYRLQERFLAYYLHREPLLPVLEDISDTAHRYVYHVRVSSKDDLLGKP